MTETVIESIMKEGGWCSKSSEVEKGTDCRDSLLLRAVRQDEGLELEVTDPQEE